MQLAQDWVVHHSQQALYRQPFGAVACGQLIELALGLQANRAAEVEAASLRLWCEQSGETVLPLEPAGGDQGWLRLAATFAVPAAACLLWYYFILVLRGGDILYYGNNELNLGGAGRLSSTPPASYQLTVVPETAATPDWWKRSVIYQIFPDRFANGRADGSVLSPRNGSLLHASWDDNPVYVKDERGHVLAYDFFGGNLAGVRQKLPYLKDLGINVIYFNPLFASVSNHKYDTADYHRIDPMLGSNQEFEELCAEAKAAGISILLDGVFSHTGSDSRYFNREATYPELGAFQSKQSPYYPWYRFIEYPERYDCWWGVDALPNVNEMEPSYREFIISGESSVLRHWLDAGAKGWRLDVVDELPDEFVKEFRQSLKQKDPEAILLGEVWEDASHKVSYGKLREYFWGNELDSVMNYPFRQAVLDFLLLRADSVSVHQTLMSLYENYPKQHFYSAMNLIGSHDVPRALTLLGEAVPEEDLPGVGARMRARLSPKQRSLGMARLKLAVLWQMTFPGTPSVYYGDEAGLEGYRDPLNRRTYPWGREDSELVAWYRQLISLRNRYPVLQTGDWQSLPLTDNVYGYFRTVRGGRDEFGRPAPDNTAVILINRSASPMPVTVPVPEAIATMSDLLCGEQEIAVKAGELSLTVAPHEGKLLMHRPAARARGAGVLLHPTCLPSPHGIGDLGPEAYAFVDWLVAAKQRFWQILPLCPPGLGDSPYQSVSAFAGNSLLISPELLVSEGLLTADEVAAAATVHNFPVDRVTFKQVSAYKENLFRLAFTRFVSSTGFEEFCEQATGWLEDYVLFVALSKQYRGRVWTDWPRGAADRLPAELQRLRGQLADELAYQRCLQYWFFRQWSGLKQYANSRGISIIGDLPLFVAHHSADVWANRDLFSLDESGRPNKVAGVPPDYFSATGQLWGNPQYRWDRLKSNDYSWWRQRLKSQFQQTDVVRIDHFRGLAAYWEIAAEADTAINGRWVKGPGADFLLTCFRQLDANFIAEDLGVITADVDELRWRFALPGMQVLQFAFSPELMKEEKHTVLYTGTHDNNTTLGWLRSLRRSDPELYRQVRRQTGADDTLTDRELTNHLVRFALSRRADTVILPLQDILELGAEARMNKPGTATGNWGWRMAKGCLTGIISRKLSDWIEAYDRFPIQQDRR
jgi:4-alpha-glucanotransferase